MALNVPVRGNARLKQVVKEIDDCKRLSALWDASNVVAMDRLQINDHGPVHIKIVCNIALKLLRLLVEGQVNPSVVADHGLDTDDAEVVVVLASALHDIGHVIHREDHERLSVVLASSLVQRFLEGIYSEEKAAVIEGEVLHAIHAHRRDTVALTVEAGVVKIADALDMEAGRARIPFDAGETTIHSVSATAIKKVKLLKGKAHPVKIYVEMSNSAGIFQLDNLLREKIKGSGIGGQFEVLAEISGEEQKILEQYTIK